MNDVNVIPAPGDGTLAENFQHILNQLPGAPGNSKLTRAWLSFNDAFKAAETNVGGNAKQPVAQSNENPKIGAILSDLCKERDLRSNSHSQGTRNARSASSFQDSIDEEHRRGNSQSPVNAHTDSDASSMKVYGEYSGSSAPSRRIRKRTYGIVNRYLRADKRPDISNMIQQHRAEDRKAGEEFNARTRAALQSRHKKWEKYKKYRERQLAKQHSSHQDNRINKTQTRKHPQQVKVNEKHRDLKKQKKVLDGLFAEAGYQ